MVVRTPWLKERSALFALSVLDALWIGFSYIRIGELRLNRYNGLDLIGLLLVCFWIFISYLSGRYSNERPEQRRIILEHARTFLVSLLMLGGAVVIFDWGLKSEDPRIFRGFLVPLLCSVFIESTLSEQLIRAALQQRRDPWIIVSNSEDLDVIKREELGQSININMSLVNADEADGLVKELKVDGRRRWGGIAIGDLHGMPAKIVDELANSRSTGLRVCSLITWCEIYLQRVPPELISPEWRLQAEGFELQPGTLSWRLKRIGDFSLAAMLLMITAPLIVISGLAIWLEDRGPIFYIQKRNGMNNTTIRIVKLRTMRVNAENGKAQWALRNDPRITRVGLLLRKMRIDELPQLINVLKGDMSLIGPRPERPEIDTKLENSIPNYRLRYLARPGMSGWAQVSFPYGASIEDSRMKLSYDIYYLRNANLLLDIFILFKTVRLVARGAGFEPR